LYTEVKADNHWEDEDEDEKEKAVFTRRKSDTNNTKEKGGEVPFLEEAQN